MNNQIIVYLVTFEPVEPNSVGGYEWRFCEAAAQRVRQELIKDSHGTYTVSEVTAVDANCEEVRDAITYAMETYS